MQVGQAPVALRDAAAGENKNRPVHRWIPWIAGFSAQIVEDAIEGYLPKHGRDRALVLDPLAGVATTLVEALKAGCNAVGYEINAFAVLAARAKINCVDVQPRDFQIEVEAFQRAMRRFEFQIDRLYEAQGEPGVAEQLRKLRQQVPIHFRSRIPFFSPPVEAKFLYALARTGVLLEPDRSLFRAALGATMVSFSNYSYEPSLSSRPGADKPLIENASVAASAGQKLATMAEDMEFVQARYGAQWRDRQREVHHASYFDSQLPANSVSLLVTSPPYMNNYHYVRNTRPQLHWLELVGGAEDMRVLEQTSFGKFWQTVRQGPRIDLAFDFPELARAIDELRALNPHKGFYGGSGWANYVATYFNDTDRFLRVIKRQLKPGAHALVVVGNSIIQGMEFRVDELVAQMAVRYRLRAETCIVRTKRVGNSIIDSSVRNPIADSPERSTRLYDAAVILRA
jgi:DNA modification methylase